MKDKYAQELELAKKLSDEAGKVMLKYFDGDQHRQTKEDGTPVTDADTTINTRVIEQISLQYPDDVILGEEEDYHADYDSKRVWICDPIDGTKPFAWGVPVAMFSLGLVVGGRPTLGVIYDPFAGRLFSAVKGQGCYLNGEEASVSSETFETGIVATSGNYSDLVKTPSYAQRLLEDDIQMANYNGWVHKAAMVASGRMIGSIDRDSRRHDLAATHVIVEEAGGRVSGIGGSQLDYSQDFAGAIASNGIIHDKLVNYLKS